jgi:hypothetical protein
LGGIAILSRQSTSGRPTVPPDTIDSMHPLNLLSIIHAKSKRPTTQRLPVRICGIGLEYDGAVNCGGRIDNGGDDEESTHNHDSDSRQCLRPASHVSDGSLMGHIVLLVRTA